MAAGQRWERCDEDIRGFIGDIVRSFRDFLGPKLTGVYLHGSLAVGSYHRGKSDIDLLIAVKKPLGQDEAAPFRHAMCLPVRHAAHPRGHRAIGHPGQGCPEVQPSTSI